MDLELLTFIAIGFLAQLVDGALGMAFGTITSSTLVLLGTAPAVASAAVHTAEIATTAMSGASHIWNRNVDRRLFGQLAITGVAGGVFGAYVLAGLPESIIKPIVTIYLAVMSAIIIARAFGWRSGTWRPPRPLLGATGGFLDAAGGGWGPLVASTLIAGGDQPRRAIGSVNLAEFFVTLSISVTFVTQLDLAPYAKLILGLVIGGALAAPLAGYLLRVLPMRAALVLVAIALTAVSSLNLIGLLR
ncbi:sulfite exporter TauE/SafE family protein [Bradyrhizobium sp. LHD-71]|uniref:sulfite exporter TauE/SafE family protein n=1 Tax=Bradyrhizobium sp. LHD-71 TaxID=3072141 RepID=UPI00280E4E30|nr:sulfite exporter TauE/SafE family protein [Bradyrhizobium sp. LHD-71]MDQ8728304.1 sulfite exporter TauE/SafE family protein [Bradyrhizobium sp. LHD-71]